MNRDRLVLWCVTLHLLGSTAVGGTISNQVTVIARGGIFDVNGAGKVAVNPASVAAAQTLDFLDSAGATYITKIFPNFIRADTVTTNKEGETVRLIDLSE